MSKKGAFISFESIDGVGKTTQVNLLAEALRTRGADLFLTKEPGDARMGSNIGAGVRDLLFREPTTHNMHPGVADLLFLADHIQTSGDITKAVENGKLVICDRYADSQFAYASSPTKRCPDWALQAYRTHFGIVPDVTILLVARGSFLPGGIEDIRWALQRAQARRGAEAGKQEGKAWNDLHEQRCIQSAYLEFLRFEERTVIIDVREPDTIEEIHSRILDSVMRRLESKLSVVPKAA